jgi:hypothetical protein
MFKRVVGFFRAFKGFHRNVQLLLRSACSLPLIRHLSFTTYEMSLYMRPARRECSSRVRGFSPTVSYAGPLLRFSRRVPVDALPFRTLETDNCIEEMDSKVAVSAATSFARTTVSS